MLTLTQTKKLIREYSREELEEVIENHSEEIVAAALVLDITLDNIDEAYAGQFDSDEDFAQDLAEQLGSLSKNPQWPYTCIDWEHAAKELMYDYCEENGYYFRNL